MPDHPASSTEQNLITGLHKISLVLKSQAWKGAAPQKLTPTQGEILVQLRQEVNGQTLSQLASHLGITLATTSDAVSMLVKKGLVSKVRSPEDARQLRITLTAEGQAEAQKSAGWTDFLLEAVQDLSPEEQGLMLHMLLKLIRGLQTRDHVPAAQMCLTCQFFQPGEGPSSPHFCQFTQTPLKPMDLKLDCPDHQDIL
ncbi:MarR family winged helix-turn-helix transcriptional regulator [Deinococcus roseus]|nr:MarR family winged helix-turn-helix transcriptional regulator [Deinococcus roseus]